jgi:hypothetical protein
MSKRKRDTEETHDEDNEERALKYQKASSTPLLELSEDEWSNISAYLSVGENIMVALSCKPLHEMITNVVKRKQPFLLTQWTIVKALLANRNALHINVQAEHTAMMEYMENNEFSKICPSGKIKNDRWGRFGDESVKFYDLLDLFSIKRDDTIDLPAFEFERNIGSDWENFEEHDLQEMYTDPEEQTFPVYSGSEVKSLNLRGTEASPDMVFKIFKYMVNLEKLTLALSEPHGKTRAFPKKGGDHWYTKQYTGVRVLRGIKGKNLKEVVEMGGLIYEKGRGYYQVMKKENVSEGKRVIVIDEKEQKMYRDEEALLKIDRGGIGKFDLSPMDGYVILVQSTSHSRKLAEGSFIMYEFGRYGTGAALEDEGDEDDGRLIVPQMEHLKYFSLESGQLSDNVVAQYMQVMPNLEELHYVFVVPAGNSFMKLLGDKNKKLKKLFIKSDSGATPYESNITDEDVLYVMQNTKLEELKMQQAANVGGRLFHTMGEYCQQLKKLNITREYHNGDLGPQDEVYFGPVVMPNMREISLNGHWDGLKQNFVDTMITAMPNLKIVHLDDLRGETESSPDYSMLVEAFDLEEFHYNYHEEEEEFASTQMGGDDALIFTLEDLKSMHMPKLRSWCGPISQDLEYLDAFHNAFPNLTSINAFFVKQVKRKDKKPEKTDGKEGEFFNDPNHWPDLRSLSLTVNKELVNLSNRPYVMNGQPKRQYGREQKPLTRDEYIRACLKSRW